MKLFLLFWDGVGIGEKDPSKNPIFAAQLPTLRNMFGGELPHLGDPFVRGEMGIAFGVDANLGMEGLPQSGTGQATIFTGVNGARLFGRHFGPFLPSSLKPVVTEKSLFSVVKSSGRKVSFANAFPQRYFEYTQNGTRRLSALVYAAVSAGVPLSTAKELSRNEAISADFVRARWADLGHPDVTPIHARDAGRHCAGIIREHDLTVLDYWLTDHMGHRQDLSRAIEVLEQLDMFLEGLLEGVDLGMTTILAVSDHGNIEDLSTKAHTRNPSFAFLVGGRREEANRLRSLTDVAPFVYECLNIRPSFEGG